MVTATTENEAEIAANEPIWSFFLMVVFYPTFFRIRLFNMLLQGTRRFGTSVCSHFNVSMAISISVTQPNIRAQFGRICDRNPFLGLTTVFYSTFFCIQLIIILLHTIRLVDTIYCDSFWRRTPHFCLRGHDGVSVSITTAMQAVLLDPISVSHTTISFTMDRN